MLSELGINEINSCVTHLWIFGFDRRWCFVRAEGLEEKVGGESIDCFQFLVKYRDPVLISPVSSVTQPERTPQLGL